MPGGPGIPQLKVGDQEESEGFEKEGPARRGGEGRGGAGRGGEGRLVAQPRRAGRSHLLCGASTRKASGQRTAWRRSAQVRCTLWAGASNAEGT